MRQTRRTLLGTLAATTALTGCLSESGDTDATTEPGDDTTTAPNDDTTTASGDDTTTADDDTTTAADTDAQTTTGGGASDATVQVRSHPDHGDVLSGPNGMTLYMFEKDTKGAGASSCTGSCADAWPPLTVEGSATTGDGVTATVSTFQRSSGETQVAVNGWPLYYFSSDEAAGDANGQGVGDAWWVLAPDGTPVKPAATTTETTGGGAY